MVCNSVLLLRESSCCNFWYSLRWLLTSWKPLEFRIWVFPKIGGKPPKSSILIGVSLINRHPFGGFSPYFWFNTHMCFPRMNEIRVFFWGAQFTTWTGPSHGDSQPFCFQRLRGGSRFKRIWVLQGVTYPLKIDGWKMNFPKWSLLRGHVIFFLWS